MTLRVAQFFLKIAHLSFSMGPRGPRAYGLRPRLWLLILDPEGRENNGGVKAPGAFLVLSCYPAVRTGSSNTRFFFGGGWSLAPDLRSVKTILAGNFRSFRVYSPEFS